MAKKNNYDSIAGSYDLISRLVFQKAIVRSQQSLLPYITTPANVLIVGGGTGWILEEIVKIHPAGLVITYLDNSTKMIALARQRNWKQNEVTFLEIPVEDFRTIHQFDIIFTPFLFDNFSPDNAALSFNLLKKLLKPGGKWLFVDFNIQTNLNRIWQKPLLQLMYRFFRIIGNVEAKQLPDMEGLFMAASFKIAFESRHYGGFILARVFEWMEHKPRS
ncbi:class I SAM-dependent methyltransferase [Dyadobacter luticola]|uniref:class I SAM-dependent methyltransferase n=1 Tax=Dyadobacter luticola TaxID=1979387 RepID=UPI0014861D33|nr:class I SAM-dependent methyltransferase [Dyadobacter luticola]